MKITEELLNKWDACDEGITWFMGQNESDGLEIVKDLMGKDATKNDWANWLIVRLMAKPQYVAYAIYAAEQVIGIYESKYPDDKRPRNAIEAAKAVLANDTPAASAASAAGDAAWAARDAAWAARDAGDAARIKLQVKILKYGIKLLEKKP